jgi:hypothetical protein
VTLITRGVSPAACIGCTGAAPTKDQLACVMKPWGVQVVIGGNFHTPTACDDGDESELTWMPAPDVPSQALLRRSCPFRLRHAVSQLCLEVLVGGEQRAEASSDHASAGGVPPAGASPVLWGAVLALRPMADCHGYETHVRPQSWSIRILPAFVSPTRHLYYPRLAFALCFA